MSKNAASELKAIFKTYTAMTSSIRKRLKKLGFSVSEGGKHYHLYHESKPDVLFVVSKTASDFRTGRNLAADILRGIA